MMQDRYVGIFWDGENVRIPNGYGAGMAAKDIDRAVSSHGAILEKHFYFDSAKQMDCSSALHSLGEVGYRLVDCPSRMQGPKETMDKKIIVDILWFVLVHSRPASVCIIVLLSGDGDYAYLSSKLKGIGIQTVVILPDSRGGAMQLSNTASVALSWKHDVLQSPSVPSTAIPAATDVSEWNADEVGDWLQSKGLKGVVSIFKKHKIRGDVLEGITEQHLQKMGLTSIGEQMRVIAAISSLCCARTCKQERSSDGRLLRNRESNGAAGPNFEEQGEREGHSMHEECSDRDGPCSVEVCIGTDTRGQSSDDDSPIPGLERPVPEEADEDRESGIQVEEGRADVFLKCVYQLQHAIGARTNIRPHDVWVNDSTISTTWYSTYGRNRSKYVAHRDSALTAKYVEQKPGVMHSELRLTPKGRRRVDGGAYKMMLCKRYKLNGVCSYGDTCGFAHGRHEVRNYRSFECQLCSNWFNIDDARSDETGHQWCQQCFHYIKRVGGVRSGATDESGGKKKTVLCRLYSSTKNCSWGDSCLFAHGKKELRSRQDVDDNPVAARQFLASPQSDNVRVMRLDLDSWPPCKLWKLRGLLLGIRRLHKIAKKMRVRIEVRGIRREGSGVAASAVAPAIRVSGSDLGVLDRVCEAVREHVEYCIERLS